MLLSSFIVLYNGLGTHILDVPSKQLTAYLKVCLMVQFNQLRLTTIDTRIWIIPLYRMRCLHQTLYSCPLQANISSQANVSCR